VRTDNANAKALYERFGFVVEGTQRRAFCVDGEFFDAYSMALVR
jgi:RimJ/RimL family protein N-acetyltransferase